MKKKLAVCLILVISILSVNPLFVVMASENLPEENMNEIIGETGNFGLEGNDFYPTPDGKLLYKDIKYDIDFATGTGDFLVRLTMHYCDYDNAMSYPPAVYLSMDTTTCVDAGATVVVSDQWSFTYTVVGACNQGYGFLTYRPFSDYLQANLSVSNLEYYACDDEGDGQFTQVCYESFFHN